MELWTLILTGGVGAAAVKLLDNVIQWWLARGAKTRDRGEEKKSDMERRIDAIAGCLMASMLDRIQFLCKCYIKDGAVDVDDLRRLHIMHDKYHGLGGNGDLDKLMEQVDGLPLKM